MERDGRFFIKQVRTTWHLPEHKDVPCMRYDQHKRTDAGEEPWGYSSRLVPLPVYSMEGRIFSDIVSDLWEEDKEEWPGNTRG